MPRPAPTENLLFVHGVCRGSACVSRGAHHSFPKIGHADGKLRTHNGRQATIPRLSSAVWVQPPAGTAYGLEVTTVEDFYVQHDDWPWNPARPGRASFHYLILVTDGVLRHDVDHVTRAVAPGQWLWVRPGHVQRWHDLSTVRGPFILFEPEGSGRTPPDTWRTSPHTTPRPCWPRIPTTFLGWNRPRSSFSTNTARWDAARSPSITPYGAPFSKPCCCASPTH